MSLSVNKLQGLLAEKGFKVISYFTSHKYCAYIEAVSINNADSVIISIPSRYEFKMRSDSAKSIYRIHSVDMQGDDETAEKFAGQPTDAHIENVYEEVGHGISPSIAGLDPKNGNIAPHLEESYHRSISIYDLEENDIKTLKSLYRQMKRLRFCLQSVRYKLSIIFGSYLCVLERDSVVDVYQISHYQAENSKKLLTIIDLELFYEKASNDRIYRDIRTLKDNLYRILNKTQDNHLTTLDKVISNKNILEANITAVKVKKYEYTTHLAKFDELLQKTLDTETHLQAQLKSLTDQYRQSGFKGLHSDSDIFMKKHKLESELTRIQTVKAEVSKNMFQLRQKTDVLYLDTDNTVFDNVVMVAAILNNIDHLSNLIKK